MEQWWADHTKPQECTCGAALPFFERPDNNYWAASELDMHAVRLGRLAAHDVVYYDVDSQGYPDEITVFGRCAGSNAGRRLSNDTLIFIREQEGQP